MTSTKVAIIYHSGYGHTEVVAKHVEKGAAAAGAETLLVKVEEVDKHWEELTASDAIIFGSPTYMGTVSAQFKEFMDKTSKDIWFPQKWKNKIAAGFTNSGSWSGDKVNTLVTMAVFAAQHAMIWVGSDIMPGNNTSKGSPEDLNRVGGFLGAMAQSNNDQGPDVAPPESDRKTAEVFGRRVADVTKQFVAGKQA